MATDTVAGTFVVLKENLVTRSNGCLLVVVAWLLISMTVEICSIHLHLCSSAIHCRLLAVFLHWLINYLGSSLKQGASFEVSNIVRHPYINDPKLDLKP